MVDDGIVILSMSVCRDLIVHCWAAGCDRRVILSMSVGRDPRVQAVGYCDRKRVRFAVKTSGLSPQALRWTISIPYHQQHVFFGLEFTVGVHGQVGVHG